MSTNDPPPDVAAAARLVQGWLEKQNGTPSAPTKKLSDAEKLDRCRQFDQSKMPEWKDPRG
jgi:hypothetical protein